MSLDLETRLRLFLASAPQSVHVIPTIQISHSAMSRQFFLWREPYAGQITTEAGVRNVQCLNFEEKLAGAEGHLDQNFEFLIDTTDVEDEFRAGLDLIPIETTEKIIVKYREYLSDDLTDIVAGPVTLQVEDLTFQKGAARIVAVSPRLNILRTGEIYAPRDVPMLRGFL